MLLLVFDLMNALWYGCLTALVMLADHYIKVLG